MSTKPGWTGRYFEDFEVGDVYEHVLGRTVTTTDNIWFTLLTQNTAPIHFDHEYASHTEFGKPLMNSAFTLALVTGQTVPDISQNVFANLAWDKITLPAPVFEGDTLKSRSKVLGKRESRSRPQVGIVHVYTEGYNQRSEVVVTFERKVLVYRRGFGPRATAPSTVPTSPLPEVQP
ncbi:MAG: acyl dehydratase [Acidobacteria bacterium]|nr:MAG: acyl dehydratase [Acidobacteriota bacterium]